MKHKLTLSSLLLCLIAISYIDNILTKSLESLYYSNAEKFTDTEGPQDKKSKGESLNQNKTKKKNNKNKAGDLKDLKQSIKYVKANNNVYLRTINFYVSILKKLDDKRTGSNISEQMLKICPKMNIFEEMRESLINCRVIQKKLDRKKKDVIKDFRVGCMKSLLGLIIEKCSVFKGSPAEKTYKAALDILGTMPKNKQKRLRILAKRFLKRFAFALKVFKKAIDERATELRKLEDNQRANKKKNNKGGKKDKNKNSKKSKKIKSFLELSNNESLSKENEGKVNEKEKKNEKVNVIEKGKPKIKEGTGDKKSGGTIKNNKNQKKLNIPKNTKYDKRFAVKIGLTKSKSIVLSSLVVKAINKIHLI